MNQTSPGISLTRSPGNVVYNNTLSGNGEDLTTDGLSKSLWIDNIYETKSENVITPAEDVISGFEDEISALVSAANLMEQEFDAASRQIDSLEELGEQSREEIVALGDTVTSSTEEIAELETELIALNDENSLLETELGSSLSYISVAGIVILVAIGVWVAARKNP